MTHQEPSDRPAEPPQAPKRPWTEPSSEVVAATDAEHTGVGPTTDGVTGAS